MTTEKSLSDLINITSSYSIDSMRSDSAGLGLLGLREILGILVCVALTLAICSGSLFFCSMYHLSATLIVEIQELIFCPFFFSVADIVWMNACHIRHTLLTIVLIKKKK